MNTLCKNTFFLLLSFFILTFNGFGNVTLTESEYERIVTRLKEDAKLLEDQEKKWSKLRTSLPKISYEIINNVQVIQKIEIEVDKDNPIVYKNFMDVNTPQSNVTYFPFRISLVGGIETKSRSDAKLGVSIFSLEPLNIQHMNKLSLNTLIGLKSSAISIGYSLPKPWSNTTIHIYYGFNYSEIQPIVGAGVGLNF